MIPEVKNLINQFDKLGYILEEESATVLLLTLSLKKPLLLEGPPGVGKTEVAKVISTFQNAEFIRLQCYEGLDINTSVYEWNYQKQLLSIKINENSNLSTSQKEELIFSNDFLLKRPLLKAISTEYPSVLLIDEVDRADEEFEAFLLELLSDFQISIPELGTVKAKHKPTVILTSNRTRELSDALKRRCLYHWVNFPSYEKELRIVKKHIHDIEEQVLLKLVMFVEHLRNQKLQKIPGIAETIDWANALITLETKTLSPEVIERTLGCVLKSNADIELIKSNLHSILMEVSK